MFFLSVVFQFIILTFISYGFYIFPIQMVLEWIGPIKLSWQSLFAVSCLISVLLTYFLRSKSKSRALKTLLHLGVGPCYFAGVITGCLICLGILIEMSSWIKCFLWVVMIGFIISYARIKGGQFIIKSLHFTSSRISHRYNIVFISDVHVGTQSVTYLEKLISRIHAINPDFVLIGGDLVDSSAVTIDDLIDFKRLKMPVYFVTGNHEYYLKDSDTLLSQLESVGIHWLRNEQIIFDEINIMGVDDNQLIEQKNQCLINSIQRDKYNIAVVHKPGFYSRLSSKPELALSGHTHNGQLFPFNWLLRLMLPYSYGLYVAQTSNFYVSSGVGTWGNNMRFGTSNELVLIRIDSTSK